MSTSSASRQQTVIPVEISAKDGVSELFLVNEAYNVVGEGVGKLSLNLPSGQYHLRQRIGDTERIQELEVSSTDQALAISLDPLDFASPAPIVGTSTFRPVPLEDWKKPEDLVGKPGLRLVIRDPGNGGLNVEPPSQEALENLRAEKARLHIEKLDGTLVGDLETGSGPADITESALFLKDMSLAPGHYVLTQDEDGGRVRCLPLIVHVDWAPRVYLLSLRDQKTGKFLPINLDNASIIYWPTSLGTSPEQSDLIRLEAARKALTRGRSVGGYFDAGDLSANGGIRDPMLALIDAHLLVANMQASTSRQAADNAAKVINAAAFALGEDFPDVRALRYAFERYLSGEREASVVNLVQTLGGPPLLAPSWPYLIASTKTNAELSQTMSFPFIPDASGTWFLWTENAGVRKGAAKGQAGAGASEATLPSIAHATSGEMFDTAVRALVTLTESGFIKDWVERLNALVAEGKGTAASDRADPMLPHIVEGLAAMQNPMFLKAFGAEELARRVLLNLNLPSDRLPELLQTLRNTLKDSGLLKPAVVLLALSVGRYLLNKFTALRQPVAKPTDSNISVKSRSDT